MKAILRLTSIALLCMLFACKSTKPSVQVERIVETVTKYDTVPVPVTVTKYMTDSSAINVLQNSNDSLLNTIKSKDAKLAYLAEQLRNGKLNTDTTWAYTDLARAWALISNNELLLGIIQEPFDTILHKINETTTTKDRQTTVETKYIEHPWYSNAWLWTTVALLLLFAITIVCIVKTK